MRFALRAILIAAVLCLAPVASWADLSSYNQDFEGLTPAPEYTYPTSLGMDGWLVYANVFSPDGMTWYYGYGPFDAPNNGDAFCAVDTGAGGPAQGGQHMSVFSDYNNVGAHDLGQRVEANVFQEQTIGAADVGTTWLFKYDAKRSNIEPDTTAKAFFKTINPFAGYSLSNFVWIDMTGVPDEWGTYTMPFTITPDLVGQLLQFGFLNTASNHDDSGIYYDNVSLSLSVDIDIKPGSCPNPVISRPRGVVTVAVLGTDMLDVTAIDAGSVKIAGVSPLRWGYDDVSSPYGGPLCGCSESGPDGYTDLTLKFKARDLMDAIGAESAGDRTLTLTGSLLDGTGIAGQDCIRVLAGGSSRSHRTIRK